METFGAAERDSGRISEIRARHATQRSVAHRRESMPMGKHEVVLCEKWSLKFTYAVDNPTLYDCYYCMAPEWSSALRY